MFVKQRKTATLFLINLVYFTLKNHVLYLY